MSMQQLRRIVFYLFLLAYLIACPLTILYALGYVFKPGVQPELIETGLIHLATRPPGATVYLQGRRYRHRTPMAIRGLLPGRYRLKLTLQGYLPWERRLQVEAERAYVLDRILLLPRVPRSRELTHSPLKQLHPIAKTPTLLLFEGSRLWKILIYNIEERALTSLIPPESLLAQAQLLSYQTVPESSQILAHIKTPQGRKWLGIDLEELPEGILELGDLILEEPDLVTWSAQVPKAVFVLRENIVDRLDLSTGTLHPRVAKGIRALGVSGEELIVVTTSGELQRLSPDGQLQRQDPEVSDAMREFFGAKGVSQIHPLAGDLLLFYGEKGTLLINRPPYLLTEEPIRGFQFDEKRQRLLIWGDRKLGIVDFERDFPLTWVWQGGRRIQQAFWVYEGSHILFRDSVGVALLEVATQSRRRLKPASPENPILYVEEKGTLFYLDRRSRRLGSMEVVPP